MSVECLMYATRNRHFRRGNLWVQLYSRMKTFLLVPAGPRTTDVPHPGASTLISAPRSNQLSNQAYLSHPNKFVNVLYVVVLSGQTTHCFVCIYSELFL